MVGNSIPGHRTNDVAAVWTGVDRSTPFLPGVFMCKSAAFVLVQVILKLINFVCGISVLCVIHLTAKFQVVVQC